MYAVISPLPPPWHHMTQRVVPARFLLWVGSLSAVVFSCYIRALKYCGLGSEYFDIFKVDSRLCMGV